MCSVDMLYNQVHLDGSLTHKAAQGYGRHVFGGGRRQQGFAMAAV
jgi:hypothetical protein